MEKAGLLLRKCQGPKDKCGSSAGVEKSLFFNHHSKDWIIIS